MSTLATIRDLTFAALLDVIDGLVADLFDAMARLVVWLHRTAASIAGGE